MNAESRHAATSRRRHRGTILIVTMVITFALAGSVIALSRTMRVETFAAANRAAALQADAIERGAEQYVLGMLETEAEAVMSLGEEQFAAVPVGDGYFWIIRPEYDDNDMPIFGLVDEGAKLNINSATYDKILRLPNMTEDIASAIMDWKDEDENPERSGPESEYYLTLPEPYLCKNANFETVEELLMVRGVTRLLLYGDGTAPPLGQRSTLRGTGSFTTDAQLARGIFDLLTIYSSSPNTSASGARRVNLRDRNAAERERLRTLLAERLGQPRSLAIMALLGRERPNDIFEFAIDCQIKPDELDKIADDLTTDAQPSHPGRVNVNTAPRQVLATLDGLDATDVDKLISGRPAIASSSSISSADPNAVGWIMDALGAKAEGLGVQITTRSSQYSADIVAVSGNGRAFKRASIVVDTSAGTPRIIYRRDLTDRGFPMDRQILANLRAGVRPTSGSGIRSGMQSARGGN